MRAVTIQLLYKWKPSLIRANTYSITSHSQFATLTFCLVWTAVILCKQHHLTVNGTWKRTQVLIAISFTARHLANFEDTTDNSIRKSKLAPKILIHKQCHW